MRAVQLSTAAGGAQVVTVPKPEPGPGQILLKVTAAGLCQSDLMLLDMPVHQLSRRFPLPLTLGHEGAGVVAALGEGVCDDWKGSAVAVYGPWGCGTCPSCGRGRENYCPRAGRLGIRPPGLGWPGAMAEYMLVDSTRHLLPAGGLDPGQVASLTDAGLTAYHAAERSLSRLSAGGAAVVVGAGGLGHLGIQILRALTSATVIAVDVTEAKLELAAEVGAQETVYLDKTAVRRIRHLTSSMGADVVLDFVGSPQTAALAAACVAVEGEVTIVGTGGGTISVGFAAPRHAVTVRGTYWGTTGDLAAVIRLAQSGMIRPRIETYPLAEAPRAYQRLRDGQVKGRAVLLPGD
jgi:alcohol dehydrogenase, propanol-preferring